ncbi:MAG TPA: hypothetical protein VFT74_13950, partial [Isosphaeraceae bacterium]|nr:hypothetical protein [Isosphaeraceae bacterium]
WPASGMPSPTGRGSAALLLAGSGSMGLVSMSLLIWLSHPDRRLQILTSVITVASSSCCALSVCLWAARPIPGQWLSLAIASFVAFGLSWVLGRRLKKTRDQPHIPLSHRTG